MQILNKIKVFLCYSSKDKAVVRELYDRLVLKNWIDLWFDEERLLPGQNWDLEIEKAVEESHVVIVCCSENSINKDGYIQRELKYVLDIALEKTEDAIFIIPLRLDNCEIPRRLKSWQYADYFPDGQKEKTLQRLIESLKNKAGFLGINTESTQSLDPSTSLTFNIDSRHFRIPPLDIGGACFLDSSGGITYLPRKQEFTVGRIDEENNIVPDLDLEKWDRMRTVSRRHAKIIFHNGKYYLQSSTNALNGTYVNEIKIGSEMHEIKDGDSVRFAGVVFLFRFNPHVFT